MNAKNIITKNESTQGLVKIESKFCAAGVEISMPNWDGSAEAIFIFIISLILYL